MGSILLKFALYGQDQVALLTNSLEDILKKTHKTLVNKKIKWNCIPKDQKNHHRIIFGIIIISKRKLTYYGHESCMNNSMINVSLRKIKTDHECAS